MDGKRRVAANLKRLRADRGISQQRLATDADLERRHIGAIERSEKSPTVVTLDKLAAALGCNVGAFFEPPKKRYRLPAGVEPGRQAPPLTVAEAVEEGAAAPPPSVMQHYTQDDLRKIAEAIDVPFYRVAQVHAKFDAAFLWFRLDAARRSGTAGHPPRGGAENGEADEESLPPRPTPTALKAKLRKVEGAARKLLKALDIAGPGEAPDGPGDGDVLDALAGVRGSDEDLIIDATERIGRLAEIVEGVNAAFLLERTAREASRDTAALGAMIVPTSHRGNDALTSWVAHMAPLYVEITGEEPGTSVAGPEHPRKGKAGGPFIRFLQAASRPLEVKQTPGAWRRRIRAVLKDRP